LRNARRLKPPLRLRARIGCGFAALYLYGCAARKSALSRSAVLGNSVLDAGRGKRIFVLGILCFGALREKARWRAALEL
jgi:hypothetical protein